MISDNRICSNKMCQNVTSDPRSLSLSFSLSLSLCAVARETPENWLRLPFDQQQRPGDQFSRVSSSFINIQFDKVSRAQSCLCLASSSSPPFPILFFSRPTQTSVPIITLNALCHIANRHTTNANANANARQTNRNTNTTTNRIPNSHRDTFEIRRGLCQQLSATRLIGCLWPRAKNRAQMLTMANRKWR